MSARCHDELVFDEAAVNEDLRDDLIFMSKCENILRKSCPDVLKLPKTPAADATRAIEKCLKKNQKNLQTVEKGRICDAALKVCSI